MLYTSFSYWMGCFVFLLLMPISNQGILRMTTKRTYLLCICLFLTSLLANAQESTSYWLDYYQYRLLTNDAWKMSQRMSVQLNPADDYDYTLTYRPDFAHKVRQHGRVIVGNGFYLYKGKSDNSTVELRPWAGFQRSPSRLSRLSLTHYVRFENRFFLWNSSRIYEGRLRYKVSALADLYANEGKALSVVLEPEIFVSLGTFDQFYFSRIQVTSGIRYQWSPYWQTDFSLIRRAYKVADPVLEDYENWVVQLKIKRLLLRN